MSLSSLLNVQNDAKSVGILARKKRDWIKNEGITAQAGRIISVSKTAPGTVHDLKRAV